MTTAAELRQRTRFQVIQHRIQQQRQNQMREEAIKRQIDNVFKGVTDVAQAKQILGQIPPQYRQYAQGKVQLLQQQRTKQFETKIQSLQAKLESVNQQLRKRQDAGLQAQANNLQTQILVLQGQEKNINVPFNQVESYAAQRGQQQALIGEMQTANEQMQSNLRRAGININKLQSGQLNVNKLNKTQLKALEKYNLIRKVKVPVTPAPKTYPGKGITINGKYISPEELNRNNERVRQEVLQKTGIDLNKLYQKGGGSNVQLYKTENQLKEMYGTGPLGIIKFPSTNVQLQEGGRISIQKGGPTTTFTKELTKNVGTEFTKNMITPISSFGEKVYKASPFNPKVYIRTETTPIFDEFGRQIGTARTVTPASRATATFAAALPYSLSAVPSPFVSSAIPKAVPHTALIGERTSKEGGATLNLISKTSQGKNAVYSVTKQVVLDSGESVGAGYIFKISNGKFTDIRPVILTGKGKLLGGAKAVRLTKDLRLSSLLNDAQGYLSQSKSLTSAGLEKGQSVFITTPITNVEGVQRGYNLVGTTEPTLRIYKKGGISYIIKNPNVVGRIIEANPSSYSTGGLQQVFSSGTAQMIKQAEELLAARNVIVPSSIRGTVKVLSLLTPSEKEQVRVLVNQAKNNARTLMAQQKSAQTKNIYQMQNKYEQAKNQIRVEIAREKERIYKLSAQHAPQQVIQQEKQKLSQLKQNGQQLVRQRKQEIARTVQQFSQRPIQKAMVRQSPKITQKTRQRTQQTLGQKIMTKQIQNLKQQLKTASKMRQKLLTKQIQKLQIRQRQLNTNIRSMRIRLGIGAPLLHLKNKPKTLKRIPTEITRRIVQPYIKRSPARKNKFSKIGKPTTLAKAEKKLFSKLDSSIKASGYLRTSKGVIIRPKSLPPQFRYSKNKKTPNLIVEKRKYRLSSPLEKKQIQSARKLKKITRPKTTTRLKKLPKPFSSKKTKRRTKR